jgi:hypothetical protein
LKQAVVRKEAYKEGYTRKEIEKKEERKVGRREVGSDVIGRK